MNLIIYFGEGRNLFAYLLVAVCHLSTHLFVMGMAITWQGIAINLAIYLREGGYLSTYLLGRLGRQMTITEK